MTAWHPQRWFGDGEGEGGLQNNGVEAEEVKIENGESRGDGAFVHLREKWEKKMVEFRGGIADGFSSVCVCVYLCLCS